MEARMRAAAWSPLAAGMMRIAKAAGAPLQAEAIRCDTRPRTAATPTTVSARVARRAPCSRRAPLFPSLAEGAVFCPAAATPGPAGTSRGTSRWIRSGRSSRRTTSPPATAKLRGSHSAAPAGLVIQLGDSGRLLGARGGLLGGTGQPQRRAAALRRFPSVKPPLTSPAGALLSRTV